MTGAIDRPTGPPADAGWGSDALAAVLRGLGLRYAAITPGASFRGLHDSLVNHLGNQDPQLLVCLHEEHAVAIAHGWAKVTGRAMAAILHSNVGVQHAAMAVFNAWCDRVPMLLIGGTGPLDARRRRDWIEWIHTPPDQAAPLRDSTKWDDRPASIGAALDSLVQAWRITETAPCAPSFVSLDAGLQEAPLPDGTALPDPSRLAPPAPPAPRPADIVRAREMLRAAKAPMILAGRMPRSRAAWNARIALAEALGARVVTDHRLPAAFPNGHPLHLGLVTAPAMRQAIADCDVLLDLDGLDRAALLRLRTDGAPFVIAASMDHHLARGSAAALAAPSACDLPIACGAEELTAALLAELPAGAHRAIAPPPLPAPSGGLHRVDIARALRSVADPARLTLVRAPTGWPLANWPITDPLSYLGGDGGAGLASGPGLAVGAALALLETGRRAVAVLGDGDFLMGASALWTAARHRIPLVIIVANDRAFGNDVMHQAAVARQRGREPANARIGQSLDDPPVDIPALARAFGAFAPPSAADAESLAAGIAAAMQAADRGEVAVVDALLTES